MTTPIRRAASLTTGLLALALACSPSHSASARIDPDPPRWTELAAASVSASAAPPTASVDPDLLQGQGRWPLAPQPPVVHSFDPPTADWESGHRGVDLAGSPGQPVLAALAGTVRFAGRIAGKGVVVLEHGGTRTTYEPVAPVLKRGDVVKAGDVVGRLEVTFSHCFPSACLHWGWRDDTRYFDPLLLVGVSPRVRLLPMWQDLPVA